MNPHRGLLHHQIITVSSVGRSKPFYTAMFTYLGYELADSHYGEGHEYEDWKPWLLDTPHEISIAKGAPEHAGVPHLRGAVGHHHHLAFCAEDRADVDRFYAEVLAPLAQQGHCTVEDPPCDCPEYGEGYYATFFLDPDGLKYEFVFNPKYLRRKAARGQPVAPPHLVAPPLRDLPNRQTDHEHLRLLAILHFVFAGLGLLGLGFLGLHYSLMHHFMAENPAWPQGHGGPLPAEFFAIFQWFYVGFGAILLIGMIANLLSAIFLQRRRHRQFSLVIAGINCLQIPFGTILGVFTIMVLMRPSVREAYARND